MPDLRLRAEYATAAELIEAFDDEVSAGGLFLAGVQVGAVEGLVPCTVEIAVEGAVLLEVTAQIAAVSPAGVAVLLPTVPEELTALVERLRSGDADIVIDVAPGPGTTAQRVAALSPTQKMQLALSGSREERLTLARDNNKTIHQYVVRNPRTTLDEAQYIAKQTTTSPDALGIIANHPEWGQDASVCAALVRNPKTPIPLAIRALDRISPTDLRTVARGGARPQIVQAARKKLSL